MFSFLLSSLHLPTTLSPFKGSYTFSFTTFPLGQLHTFPICHTSFPTLATFSHSQLFPLVNYTFPLLTPPPHFRASYIFLQFPHIIPHHVHDSSPTLLLLFIFCLFVLLDSSCFHVLYTSRARVFLCGCYFIL